ncbi:2-oxoacid:acceptor oxidoreductase subunit alpha [Anaeromyxobacter sp. Fw109-5]|uniref:2-oxoacid:acceptor oxidoreductase subunit alpha n=1 Tax=Anaeromyxobacter sp. (strain Fw109-5) TaxID=404589 RepID=UPI0000ED81C4|nr:2-oxoacid:acceptor oxidoreductase subunit alpha [Anaeromyxobacter sp. Fw109-5]ABS26097.1 pyruvate flavodoxin/ferredoxin oxidoreductase domain protein [Anaeromyxobacter sp. Fw109-5]
MSNATSSGTLTGSHYLDGDHACSEGAIAAGCRFAAGYPITPSTEVVERLAQRFPLVGGRFLQFEDELAASIALLGGAWGGAKACTVTSGPGFSLMMEHIGLAAITETPCVFFDVQRAGPSTGLPTQPAQGDMMQARFGSHGDYRLIALCPNSPQECFDLTVDAFNMAEEYRVPVLVMLDEVVGHMTEKVVIPDDSKLKITERRWTKKPPGEFKLFAPAEGSLVPEMVKPGDGYRIHVTGLTHDERGYPKMTVPEHEKMQMRLWDKIVLNADKIVKYEAKDLDDAEVVVVSYGITSRIAERAIQQARAAGVKVGSFRLITAWPFPEKEILQLSKKVKAFVVPELNLGQMVLEVQRIVEGRTKVVPVPHVGGTVHDPQVITNAIVGAVR